MPTVYMTMGLPGSGKSTLARQMVLDAGGTLVEVSKDDLRKLPDAPASLGKRERWVVAQRDRIVAESLAAGLSIVVHDTNLNPVHERRLRALADEHGAEFEVLDLRNVDVLECIKRDAARPAPVGESVIWTMWQKWMYVPPASSDDTHLPAAVLVDIDGTLARMNGRSPFAWHEVDSDLPVPHVVELVRDLAAAGTQIVYLSGRDGSCRELTEAWLATHVGVDGPLLMRPAGDMRADSLVKAELFDAHIRGRYRVRFVLDDRNQVVFMWRTVARVPVLQVEYGYF